MAGVTTEARTYFGENSVLDSLATWVEQPAAAPMRLSTLASIELHQDTLKERPKEIGQCAIAIAHAVQAITFCQAVVDAKARTIARGILFAVNEQSPLLLAMTSRSMLEHLATKAYLAALAQKTVESIRGAGALARATDQLSKLSEACRKLYFGSSALGTGEKPVHVHDSIEKLAKTWPTARKAYDFLCDFVHPNFGSNVLVAGGHPGEGEVLGERQDSPEVLKVRRRLLQILGELLAVDADLTLSAASAAGELDGLFTRCLDMRLKATQVLATPGDSMTGDGQTKDTAFWFRRASSHQDFLSLQYSWLDRHPEVKSWQRRPYLEGDWIYDVYTDAKSGQQRWFKTPNPSLQPGVYMKPERGGQDHGES